MVMGFFLRGRPFSSSSTQSQSMTTKRLSRPTWGAAMPTPSVLYMSLAMSLASFLMDVSPISTGSLTSRSRGSGRVMMFIPASLRFFAYGLEFSSCKRRTGGPAVFVRQTRP